MTIFELAQSYRQTASTLWARIRELEGQSRAETDPMRRQKLLDRVRPLRSMYRDAQATAKYLECYYEGSVK